MKIQKIRDVKTPSRGTEMSAGIDFYVPNDFNATEVNPGESINIPSGILVKIPSNYMLCAFNKSGVALKKGLQVGACVVDEDYQGEVHLHVFNVGLQKQLISPGEKLVQFVLIPIIKPEIEILEKLFDEKTERSDGGFGSTGTS